MNREAALPEQTSRISGLGAIAHLYQGFILDLWGVVHDGVEPFPETVATLKELRRAKRKVWMLSNAPRRSWVVQQKLAAMGIGDHLYDGIVTSGEATWMALRDAYLGKWGRRCFHLGPREKDASLYEDLDIRIVPPDQADFVLASGVEDFSDPAEKYAPVLAECAARGLPMLCANPDRIVHVGEQLVVCPGIFADMYESMGGAAVRLGKPYREVYALCLDKMGSGAVVAVGDGMQTDIAGATAAGLDSVLVTSGIHRDEVAGATAEGLSDMLRRYPYQPTYLMTRFCW